MLDTVIICDGIFTAEPGVDRCIAGAIGIEGKRIAVVGSVEDVVARAGDETEVIDATGKFICPGLVDSHLHFYSSALVNSPYVSFCFGSSAQECIDALKEVENARPRDKVMIGCGWYHPIWENPVEPDRSMLDAVYSDRPVVMVSCDFHTLWCNTLGLQALGVDESVSDPAGGEFSRDAEGRLTGIIKESACFSLVPQLLDLDEKESLDAIAQFLKRLNSFGITGVGDMSLAPLPGADLVRDDLYEKIDEQGELTVRMNLFPSAQLDLSRPDELSERFSGNDMIGVPGLKQFMDGVSSTHTAWLIEPYEDAYFPGDNGRPTIDPEEMRKIVLNAGKHGYAVRVHAIGDQAVKTVIDIFEEKHRLYGMPRSGRDGVEHADAIHPDDLKRLVDAGIVVNCQPPHLVADPDGEERAHGMKRAMEMWPFRDYVDNGVPISFGTDSPVVDIDSRVVVYNAVTRRHEISKCPDGGWNPAQRVTVAESLRAYTLGGAQCMGREDDLGTLESGKLADLAVFDTNLLSCDPEEILSAQVLQTYVGGRKVYEL